MSEKFDLKGKVEFDAGDPEIHWILSQMIFTTGPISHKLRRLGYEIQGRAEEEQAAVLIWMIRCYQKFGAEWKSKGQEILLSPPTIHPAGAPERSL